LREIKPMRKPRRKTEPVIDPIFKKNILTRSAGDHAKQITEELNSIYIDLNIKESTTQDIIKLFELAYITTL